MTHKSVFFYWFICFFLLLHIEACQTGGNDLHHAGTDTPYVVILSMDGFRWDYTEKVHTPNFDYIAQHGVKAESIQSSFPTKTFPNHYSIATGMYPDNHGIVLNNFYDPDMQAFYSPGDRSSVENEEFYGGEPIWVTAEKQNIITASYFWIGSEAPVKGIQPTYWKTYEHDFPYLQRLDSVIAWLNLPENERPHLITWYVDEPDSRGHTYGPDSQEVNSTIEYLDSLLGVFIHKIEDLPHAGKINVIVTSDHGMAEIKKEKSIILTDHIHPDWFEIIQGGNPVYTLKVKSEFYDTAYSILTSITHISVWKSFEVPEKFHYGNNPRVLDFIVLADSSWSVTWDRPLSEYAHGAHGYDNYNRDMYAIFYAFGPSFKSGYVHPGFENVDIYPLVAEILGIEPADMDGELETVRELLNMDK